MDETSISVSSYDSAISSEGDDSTLELPEFEYEDEYENEYEDDAIGPGNPIVNRCMLLANVYSILSVIALGICAALSAYLVWTNCNDFLTKWAIGSVVYHVLALISNLHTLLKEKYTQLEMFSTAAKVSKVLLITVNYIGSWVLIGYAIYHTTHPVGAELCSEHDYSMFIPPECRICQWQIFNGIYIYMLTMNILSFFFYTCLLCVICMVAQLQVSDDTVEGADETTILQNTIIKKFSEWMGIDSSCPICMEEYQSDDQITKLHCGHYYHSECINEWLAKSAICPYCKQKIDRAVDLKC